MITKTVEVDAQDAANIRMGLTMLLSKVYAELRVLEITRERDLNKIEIAQLPHVLREFSREQLMEQVDPWISWTMSLEHQIKTFSAEGFL